MSLLGNIYRNSARVSERSMNKDKKYIKAKNQVNQCYQLLSKKLSKNELAALDKLISCCDTKTERKCIYCFKSGFETGLAAAIEALR